MPAVFAETVIKNCDGTQVGYLQAPGKGEGYIVNLDTGAVLRISSQGISELEKPKPATKIVDEVRNDNAGTPVVKVRKAELRRPTILDVDDIPF